MSTVRCPYSRAYSATLRVHTQWTCSCIGQNARYDPQNDCNGVWLCEICSNTYFDKLEHQNKIETMPIRFDKLEEHTNHIESKVNALETEINEITKITKTYSETSHTDITILNSRVDMLNEQLKTTNSRIDEIFLVFIDIKNMFLRYNNIVDMVEKQIGTPQIQELSDEDIEETNCRSHSGR
jgi:predicted RNase H-like nuclease (RuvC/YqgF family)